MTDRLRSNRVADLEAALVDLGTAVEFPATPDLAGSVGARLRAQDVVAVRPRRPVARRLVRSLLLAAAISIALVGTVLGIRLGLDLLSIEFGPVPSPSPTVPAIATSSPSRPGDGLGLGDIVPIEDARAAAPFRILIPTTLPTPSTVFMGGPALRGQIAIAYPAGPDLPPSDLLGGAGLLITQNAGSADEGLANKLVDAGLATVDKVVVAGAPGLWISGPPHLFWYLDPDGEVVDSGRRLIGDALVWERDGVLYRIEGAISLARALEIAEAMS